jgi:hypothetical protein
MSAQSQRSLRFLALAEKYNRPAMVNRVEFDRRETVAGVKSPKTYAYPVMGRPILQQELRNSVVSYDQEIQTEHANRLLGTLARLHLDQVTESGWACAGWEVATLLYSGDYPGLCLLELDTGGLVPRDAYHLNQVLAFYRKRSDIVIPGVNPEATAIEKFVAAEDQCELTNDTFRAWQQGRFQFRPLVERVLHAAREKIAYVLGEVPSLRELRPRFGPGASTQVVKKNACVLNKTARPPACTANFTRLEEALATLGWSGGPAGFLDVEIHTPRVGFVPKSAKTKRAIVTECALNSLFQLGLGDEMARRIKTRTGIDISDQTANQRAAMYGSMSGSVATIDLSSASDTVARGLVEHLFSEEWISLFDCLRAAEVEVTQPWGSYTMVLQKISSMGNGFTFPLETLIFWAISLSVTEIVCPRKIAVERHGKMCKQYAHRRVLAYGDDIIVPTEAAPALIGVLKDLGFTPNPSKSFWTGNFRESCGKDYIFGTDVRPANVDIAQEQTLVLGSQLFTLHNFYSQRGLWAFASFVEQMIHPSIRLRGPSGYGDGHLHSHVWLARTLAKDGRCGFSFETFTYSVRELREETVTRMVEEVRGRGATRAFVYRREKFHHLVRLAAYSVYLREEVERGDRLLPCGEPRGDRDFLVVPGVGPVKRTKVYVFEPPRLH